MLGVVVYVGNNAGDQRQIGLDQPDPTLVLQLARENWSRLILLSFLSASTS